MAAAGQVVVRAGSDSDYQVPREGKRQLKILCR